jgi:hypothetical protein
LGVFSPQPCTLEISLKAVNHPKPIKAGEGAAELAQQQQQQQQRMFDPPLSTQRLELVKRVAQEVQATVLVDAGEPPKILTGEIPLYKVCESDLLAKT